MNKKHLANGIAAALFAIAALYIYFASAKRSAPLVPASSNTQLRYLLDHAKAKFPEEVKRLPRPVTELPKDLFLIVDSLGKVLGSSEIEFAGNGRGYGVEVEVPALLDAHRLISRQFQIGKDKGWRVNQNVRTPQASLIDGVTPDFDVRVTIKSDFQSAATVKLLAVSKPNRK